MHEFKIGKGGTNDPTNLQTLCRECNADKAYNENELYKNLK
jgi:5-methylcytosine-specific restriction endonuclease McrA